MQANPVRTRINDDGAGVVGGIPDVEMLQFWVAVCDAESRTLATKVLVPPPPVGVPLITPVEAPRLKPGGSDPVWIENV